MASSSMGVTHIKSLQLIHKSGASRFCSQLSLIVIYKIGELMKTFMLLLTALLISCSQGIDTSDQVSVAKNFYDALMKNDIKLARTYMSDKENLPDDGKTSFEINEYHFSNIATNKDQALITTSATYSGGVSNFSTVLSKVNGEWKIVIKETMRNMVNDAIENNDYSVKMKLNVTFKSN